MAACSTAYQPMATSGGYTDEPLGDGTYLVTVKVNAYTDASTAFQYFHRRSAELCRENGFRSYNVLDSDRSAKRSIVSGGSNQLIVVEKARAFGRIECIGSSPTAGPTEVSLDAEFLRIDTIAKRLYIDVVNGNQNTAVAFDDKTLLVYRDRSYPMTALEFGDLVRLTVRQIAPDLFHASRIDVSMSVQDRKK